MMHVRLVGVLGSILKDVRIPYMAMVTKDRGLGSADASRHGDAVVLAFFCGRQTPGE